MRNSGFSMLELLTVIVILSVLIAIAGLNGRDWMDRYRVEGQIKEMYTDLMNARVSAMQRNRVFFVKLAANQYAIYEDIYSAVTPSSPDGDGVLQPNDRLVMQKTTQYTLNYNESFSLTNFNFTQNGLVSWSSGTNGGTIWFTSTANPASDCIALATTRIIMGKWNGTSCDAQ